jgi:hypothetical protein
MATRYFGTTVVAPNKRNDFVGASSGGTLAGSQYLQLVWDDSIFGSTPEGKQRLLAALKQLEDRLQTSSIWPIDSTA